MLPVFAAAVLSLTGPAIAQEPVWTHIAQGNGSVMFVLGGPETHAGVREVAMAIAPAPGRTRQGIPVGFYVLTGTVDCSAWTLRQESVQYFGTDAQLIDVEPAEGQSAAPIPPGTANAMAAEVKCRGRVAASSPVAQSQLVEAAAQFR